MPPPRSGWPTIIGIALLATLLAMLVQFAIRSAWQVRTLPERVMEWLLLFVPLDLFEGALRQFGASAKDLALIGTFAGMGIVLLFAGSVALRKSASGWLMLLLGLGLWLFAMLVVMPI